MFWPVVNDISFKDISIFSSSAELKGLSNCGRGHQK